MAKTPAAVKPADRAARRRKSTPKRKFPTAPARRKPADYLLSTKASCEYLGVSRTMLYSHNHTSIARNSSTAIDSARTRG
jgi:hypothetical protein